MEGVGVVGKSFGKAREAMSGRTNWANEKGVPNEFLYGKTFEDHKNGLAADFICAFCNRIAADPVATACDHYFW